MLATTNPPTSNNQSPLMVHWLRLSFLAMTVITMFYLVSTVSWQVGKMPNVWEARVLIALFVAPSELIVVMTGWITLLYLRGAHNEIYWPNPWSWHARVMRAVRADKVVTLTRW